jgi:hypothetical protein
MHTTEQVTDATGEGTRPLAAFAAEIQGHIAHASAIAGALAGLEGSTAAGRGFGGLHTWLTVVARQLETLVDRLEQRGEPA